MSVCTYENLMYVGRLGNQLWQVAAVAGMAKRKRAVPRFRPDWTYRKFFNVPDELFEPYDRSDVCWDGGTEYYQELHYIRNVPEVREWFTAKQPDLIEYPDQWFQSEHKTAIHVRRGDYLKYPDHFPIPTMEYFQSAINKVLEDGPTTFYVFSDDPEWCERTFDMEFHIVRGRTTPVEVADRDDFPMDWCDLIMMAECDRHIISNSSFSWWGGYLSNDDRVIYPSRWWGPKVPNHDRWELAMPDTWERVNL